jgi:hypothetical protein
MVCREHVCVAHMQLATHMAGVTYYTYSELDNPAITYEACRRRSCIRSDVTGPVLLLLRGPGLVYSSRERLLLPQVVEVLSVQHLRALCLPVDLVGGAILAVDLAQPVVPLVAAERAVQCMSIQRR